MFCWHEWKKWSEVKQERWIKQYRPYGYPIGEPQEFVRLYQGRFCEKCGKYQKRYLSEE